MRNYSLPLSALLLLPLLLTACSRSGGSGGASDDTVAVVNGARITRNQFITLMEHRQTIRVDPNSIRPNGMATVPGSVGFQSIADLIRNQLVLQLAKDEGVAPTETDIQKELQYQITRKPDYLKLAMEQGFTKDAILDDLRIALAQERVITKGITVPDDEVDRYIKNNPTQFEEPKSAQLSYIVVASDEKKKQVDEQLNGKVSFSVVASQLSEAPGAKSNQGRFPETDFRKFSPTLQALVDRTLEGQSTDWIKEGNSWVKFFVEQKRAARAVPITPVLKEAVKRNMAMMRGQKGSDFERKLSKKVLSANVQLTNPRYQELWKKTIESAKANETR